MNTVDYTKIQSVYVVPQAIETDEERGLQWMALLFILALRTLIVWGFLATCFPALGFTYFFVAMALIALGSVKPSNGQALIALVKRSSNKPK